MSPCLAKFDCIYECIISNINGRTVLIIIIFLFNTPLNTDQERQFLGHHVSSMRPSTDVCLSNDVQSAEVTTAGQQEVLQIND